MNYIDLLAQEENQSSAESSLVEILKNSLKKRTGILENTKRIQSQIIDRAASAFDCYSQC